MEQPIHAQPAGPVARLAASKAVRHEPVAAGGADGVWFVANVAPAGRTPLTGSGVQALQRAAGNRAVARLLNQPVQRVVELRKLKVTYGAGDDQLSKLKNDLSLGKKGDYDVDLRKMIESEDTYSFADGTELHSALQAQAILDHHKTDALAYVKNRSKVVTANLQSKRKELSQLRHDKKLGKEIGELKGEDRALSVAGAYTLSETHGVEFHTRADSVLEWGGDELIKQTPQQRGDMTHVLPALVLSPQARVVLCFERTASMLADADEILTYYRPRKSQVCVYLGSPNDFKARPLTYSTEILKRSSLSDPLEARKKIQDATTGILTEDDLNSYEKWVQDMGFQKGNSYVIVSHRDTGHRVPEGRQASHPELDTGEEGFLQLIAQVKAAGFIPVPMGEPQRSEAQQMKPSMVQYWQKRGELKFSLRTKRQIEYGLIRYLAENYGVRLLAMRSGNTDAMAFAGMETIFIDLASEGADAGELHGAGLNNPAHNRSWRRAAMLETILPGVFHQAFFSHPRREESEKSEEGWNGAFSRDDIEAISQSIKKFFGMTDTIVTDRSHNSPLRPENRPTFHKRAEAPSVTSSALPATTSPRFETFSEFAQTIEKEREQLLESEKMAENLKDLLNQRKQTVRK